MTCMCSCDLVVLAAVIKVSILAQSATCNELVRFNVPGTTQDKQSCYIVKLTGRIDGS